MPNLDLVIWVNSPPFVERGALDRLVERWPGAAQYAVLGEMRSERAAMGWGSDSDDLSFLARPPEQSIESFVRQILREAPNATHLIAGLSSSTGKALREIVEHTTPNRVAVYTERPGVHGTLRRRLLATVGQPVRYRLLVRRYRTRVGLLLPLGEIAVRRFARYGWPQGRMRSFMYCPPAVQHTSVPVRPEKGAPVRFLYVGRMSRFAKGTDLLLSATSSLTGSWTLTLVGGHGDYNAEVMRRTQSDSRLHHLGPRSPGDVSRVILDHDVVIVPSRVDGYNVVVVESLRSGRGAIVTDRIASDELIAASGAGVIVRAGSVPAIAGAMQDLIENPELISKWSERAEAYAKRLSPESAGDYIFDLLSATRSGETLPHSAPPWSDAVAGDHS